MGKRSVKVRFTDDLKKWGMFDGAEFLIPFTKKFVKALLADPTVLWIDGYLFIDFGESLSIAVSDKQITQLKKSYIERDGS